MRDAEPERTARPAFPTSAGGPGLCPRCMHVRVVESDRRSRFYQCRLAASEPRFPRWPIQPVLACPGFRE